MKPARAIELMGTVDNQRQLHLDEPLDQVQPGRVRVIVIISEADEIEETVWLRGAAQNPAFEFLKDSAEDIFCPTDGKPFHLEL